MTLVINWAIKPFTMYLIASFFLGFVFRGFIPGTEIIKGGRQEDLWRSYISGTIILSIAPCTAMVLIWGYLARGNDGLTLVMVAIATATMLYGLSSGASLATVVGVLIEVPVMLMLVGVCKRTTGLFKEG